MSEEKVFIPISKLNTFAFCPRRFFYEFIEGEERSNEFVEDGANKHEAVNVPADEIQRGGKVISRQVYVASEQLGVSGYVEVMEEEGGVVRPVEYKRGHLGDWWNDKVQLCAQALCLEEMRGVTIASGDLFYISSHRRKEVVFDERLRQGTKEVIAQAHALVQNPKIPPPVNDNRCNGCSVKGICLPSEVALLLKKSDEWRVTSDESTAAATSAAPRHPSPVTRHPQPSTRILPSLGMERVLYVDTQGAYIRKTDERLIVAQRDKEGKEEVLRDFPIINLDQVVVAGNVGFTTPAARFLLHQGVKKVFLSSHGTYEGTLTPEISKNSLVRIAQHRALADEARVLHLLKEEMSLRGIETRGTGAATTFGCSTNSSRQRWAFRLRGAIAARRATR